MGGSFGRWFGYTDRSVACAEEAGLLRHVSDCDPEAIRLERRLHHLLGNISRQHQSMADVDIATELASEQIFATSDDTKNSTLISFLTVNFATVPTTAGMPPPAMIPTRRRTACSAVF